MTCVLDQREHVVTESEFAVGARHGRYLAACGYVVVPGSLASPPGRPCQSCLSRVRPKHTPMRADPNWANRFLNAAHRLLGHTTVSGAQPRSATQAGVPSSGLVLAGG